MSFSVSVVIPNYNGKELLEKNLPSVVRALEKAQLTYEIIIPDDNSSDTSVEFVRSHYPKVIVLAEKNNLGFSGNINRGLKLAKNDLVLALNSDIFLHEDYFLSQLSYFANKEVFGVMGAICDPQTQQPSHLNMGAQQDFFGVIKAIELVGYQFDRAIPMYFPSGSNILVDREKLRQLNYFNELFSPFYGEDIDLDLRAWRRGWVSYYEPQARCYHQSSATIKKYNKQKKIRLVSRRNKMLLHCFHLQGWNYFKFCSKMCIDTLTRFLIMDFGYYQALGDFLKRRPQLMEMKKNFPAKLTVTQALQKCTQMIQKALD